MINGLVFPLTTYTDSAPGFSWIVDSARPPYRMRFDDVVCAEIFKALNSHDKMIDALQMAKHVIDRDGTQAELYEVFAALEAAGVKP